MRAALRSSNRAGDQDEDQVVLTFSGEVYNFTELRTELTSLGHEFRTRSDTEVVLHAYLQWGADCVTRLNGMFAFGIWDGRRQELLLARDRLGVKPLYYAPLPDGVLFGSEPKAILAHPGFRAEIDAEGLAELFAQAGTATPGHSVYRGLSQVRPGTIVQVGRFGLRTSTYWTLEAREHTDDLAATARERPRAPGRHRAPPDRRRRAAVQPAVRRPRLERRLRAGGRQPDAARPDQARHVLGRLRRQRRRVHAGPAPSQPRRAVRARRRRAHRQQARHRPADRR